MRYIKTTECWLGWILKLPIKVEDTGGETNVRQKLESSALGIRVHMCTIHPSGNASVKLGISEWNSAEKCQPERLGSHQYSGNKLRE